MTEDEARQKWCHKTVRLHYDIGTDEPKPWQDLPTCRCIASDCMAWRKDWDYGDDERAENKSGYCGLAGKPR